MWWTTKNRSEWTPFGIEVGVGQAGLGYTGEWWDPNVGLTYLRARWYAPYLNQFISPDTIVPDFRNPQSINRYVYALGNPIRYVDPSGRCATDCECFVQEVERFIALARKHTFLGGQEEMPDEWVVHMLGGYYAGFQMTVPLGLGCAVPIPPGVIIRGPTPERWPVRDSIVWQVFDEPPAEGAEAEALRYGFRRIFYNNTHHYFYCYYAAYFYGPDFARYHNNQREADQYAHEGHDYYETAADIMIVEMAIEHRNQTHHMNGDRIEALPQLLREDACGKSLEEIYEGWEWPNPIVEAWLGPPP